MIIIDDGEILKKLTMRCLISIDLSKVATLELNTNEYFQVQVQVHDHDHGHMHKHKPSSKMHGT